MFNLVDEAWIPVRGADGRAAELSLRELFARAEDVSELAIAFAPERMAVTRILVAVLQSALRGPSGIRERARWLQEPQVIVARVIDYLDEWRWRFDLFDSERPFMQQPIGDRVARSTIAALKLDWASGNNVTLFDHHVDARPAELRPAEAARALLTTLLYQPGGGVSVPFNRTDSPGARPLFAMAIGRSLWEDMVLNTAALPSDGADAPIWERDEDHLPRKEGTVPLGWLDRVTWRSRAVQLECDSDGLVRSCRVHQHLRIVDGPPFDPFAPVRRVEGEEPRPVRAGSGRRLWRSADTVLRGLADRQQPPVVAQAVDTLERLGHAGAPQMLLVAMQVERGKIADAQSARLPVSGALLADADRLDFVTWQLEQAAVGARAIRAGIMSLLRSLGAKPESAHAGSWVEQHWATLAPRFSAVLQQVAEADIAPALNGALAADWNRTVASAARSVFERVRTQAAPGPRHFEALARATRAFNRALRPITAASTERAIT